MKAGDLIAIAAIAISLAVAVIGWGDAISTRRKFREYAPRIEFEIDCEVVGQEGEDFLVQFILIATNRGRVRWEFKSILLRVRGIPRDDSLVYWKGRGQRLYFPVKIMDKVEVIPREGNREFNFLFVEPGVRQAIAYVTKIPTAVSYIVVFAEFQYTKINPHTAEKVFRLDVQAAKML